jgi:hypothetical protein
VGTPGEAAGGIPGVGIVAEGQIRPGVGTPGEAVEGIPGVGIVAAGQIRPGVGTPGEAAGGIPGVGPRAFGVLADGLPFLAWRRFHQMPCSYSVFGQYHFFLSPLER